MGLTEEQMRWPSPPKKSIGNIIADIDWLACDDCKHCREDCGGCDPLDNNGVGIFEIDTETECVTCVRFEKREK